MTRLFVGNLPFAATETDVQNFFTSAGFNIESVSLMRDRFTGEARGFGFVEVDDAQAEQAIQACNGRDLMGRSLVVNEARPMTERGSGPRGGGGGGRRDFGGGGGGGRGRQGGGGGGGDRW